MLRKSNVGSEQVDILNQALCESLRSLGLVDRDGPITEIVARKIIGIAVTGIRDPAEISDIALKQLKTSL